MSFLDRYVEHSAGLLSFLSWIETKNTEGKPYEITKQIVFLNQLISKYFSIGITYKKGKREIFFAIQPIESEWFSLIKWNKIVLRKNDQYIYFVAESMRGDEDSNPDIPSFGLAFYVDTQNKKELLSKLSTIAGREYFLDDDKRVKINFHKKIFNLPIEIVEANEQIIKEQKLFDFSDVLAKKEGRMSGYSEKPIFSGELARIEGTDDLLKKWKDNKI